MSIQQYFEEGEDDNIDNKGTRRTKDRRRKRRRIHTHTAVKAQWRF